jgi:replicative DNA helicase
MLSMKEQVMSTLESIEKLFENKGAITGVSTGFRDFDKLTSGLHSSEMIVIAARPSMGKTALAMNIAEHAAIQLKLPVAIFSLEMSAQQLVQRMLCSRARVNLAKTRDGFLSEADFPKLTNAASKLAEAKIFIDDSAGLSILELRAKARRLKAQQDVQLIVVDYLQLLRSTSRRAQDNRQLEISEISAGLKGLAKELKIPIIVAAQLNRNPEIRTGSGKGVPRLADLRESGSIEQDADLVGLLVREEYYADSDEERAEMEGKAELIIAKQRNGPIGQVKLTFLKDFTRFQDRAEDTAEPEEAF